MCDRPIPDPPTSTLTRRRVPCAQILEEGLTSLTANDDKLNELVATMVERNKELEGTLPVPSAHTFTRAPLPHHTWVLPGARHLATWRLRLGF